VSDGKQEEKGGVWEEGGGGKGRYVRLLCVETEVKEESNNWPGVDIPSSSKKTASGGGWLKGGGKSRYLKRGVAGAVLFLATKKAGTASTILKESRKGERLEEGEKVHQLKNRQEKGTGYGCWTSGQGNFGD